MFEHLPGGEILEPGLRDLRAGVRSVSALLIMIAAPRLARCGISIPGELSPSSLPEHELYNLLVAEQGPERSEEHTSELQSLAYLVCRLLLEKKKNNNTLI